MMKWTIAGVGVVGLVVLSVMGLLATGAIGDDSIVPADDADALLFVMTDIDGVEQDLEQYRGTVVLMVNVASECGLTPQYEALEALYLANKDAGFVVLGFPANDFMGQEPGTDEQIKLFCEEEYAVTFPMFSKITVKGEEKHELYAKLTGQPEPVGGAVAWNFQKYLIDRSGNVVEKFSPRVKPLDPKVVGRVQELLGEE